MVPRYPYFCVDLLQLSRDTLNALTSEHKAMIKDQFGVDAGDLSICSWFLESVKFELELELVLRIYLDLVKNSLVK